MIGPKMQEALNRHVQHETFSSYLYVAMAAWCEAKAWKGFARWLRAQADEERDHAAKSLEYLLARGGEARLGAIDAPPFSWPRLFWFRSRRSWRLGTMARPKS